MGQTDNGSVFGGLTQMVVPAGAPPTPTAPPPPSFDHLNTIQVAPPTSARAQNQTQPNTTIGQPQGLMESGNLDLNNRPVVHNEDGTHSSEYSISFGTDKGEVLVPTVVNGRFLTPSGKKPPEKSAEEQQMFDNARRHYENTGEHMGIFDTPENADAYANQVHNRGNSPAMPVDRTLYRKLPTSQPSTSKNTGGASGSWGDTIGPSKSTDRTEVHQLSPGEQPNPNYDPLGGIKEGIDKITSEIENYDQQGRGEHPVLAQLGDAIRNAKELLYGGQAAGKPLGTSSGVLNNPVSQSIMMAPGAAEAGAAAEEKAGEVAGKVGNKVVDALAHPTHAAAPAEGNPEAGLMRLGTKGYHEQNFSSSVPVKVTFEDGTSHIDAVKGLNRGHAIARAVENWPGAQIEEATPEEADAAGVPRWHSNQKPNYVYRSRDIGEQGVPANEDSHAQLTSSEDQARLYTQPGQRDAVTGKPQELVRVDLNKLRPSDYSTKKMDEGVNWHKLKRDVPEELVEKMPVDYHAIGKQQGVQFRGVQKGVEGHPGLAIFQDPQSGTSVAVRLDEWSPAKLAEHVAQARQRMAGTSNKPSLLGKQ